LAVALTTLTIYLDEAGTDEANPCLIVGGFAASVEQWDHFARELQILDAEFNAPPFHAKEFEKARHGYGPYAGWPKSSRKDYLNRFLGIIGRRCFKSFVTILEKIAYEKIIRPQEALREYFYSPFVFAAINCVHAVVEWRDKSHPGEPLLFVFDRGNKNQGQLENVAKKITGDDRLIQDMTTGDDVKSPQLRAADLLAFEWCSEARAAAKPHPNRPFTRYPLLQIDETPHDWVEVGENNLLTCITELINDGVLLIEKPPSD
jgi:hypothetical protein